jgi:hypothetical protein
MSGRGGLGRQCTHPGSSHEGHWGDSARMWEVVLRPTVADETNGGGRWSELMVVVVFVQVGGGPTHFSFGLISLELVQAGQME